MNQHTKPKTVMKPKSQPKTTPSSGEAFLNEINKNRYVIALEKYLGFDEVTQGPHEGAVGGPYDFDFMVWPSWHYVKVFTALDDPEVQKYAEYPKPHKIISIIDVDACPDALAHIEKGRITRCTLTPDAFRAAQSLKAYIYFQRRIWTSHMGMNLWEPLLPLEDRILHARDWELTQPAPATVMTKSS
jgi:hypothetical protein